MYYLLGAASFSSSLDFRRDRHRLPQSLPSDWSTGQSRKLQTGTLSVQTVDSTVRVLFACYSAQHVIQIATTATGRPVRPAGWPVGE